MLERVERKDACHGIDRAVPASPLLIYVINLDRCIERWDRLRTQAVQHGLNLVRVAAVDGQSVLAEERVGFHPRSFSYHNGRTILAGEYGCYRSHLLALETFVASGDAMAIIIEDDVDLNAALIPRAMAAVAAVPGTEGSVIKLANHRKVGFRPVAMTTLGDVVGRCLHGPQGSAACYIVTREAALKLVKRLNTVLLPYDVALERGWSTGVQTFSTEDNLVTFSPHRRDTTIGKRSHYRAAKRHFMLRMTTHWFRAHDQLRRWFYATWGCQRISR
ncbi:glycosyltransferase family 25 protein [Rhizobium sp. B21/90]|uniref:glycosyltransferase family 25 protein n=1 Tax=Rhizobium sp. B21/90 TaxID=2819993 RepID=UPI001C5AA206|nr:glycosyltransferase family 25 protein [Rhizobium sp. B21/90]QYA04704.1 glycosyltransferase family 25 protein [Rhizobium sp. B21/90]